MCLVTGVQTSARAHLPTKELFQIIPTHMMNREIIPGRKKEGSTMSSINCDCCWHLDQAVSRCWPRWHAEVNRRGWPLAEATYSTSQAVHSNWTSLPCTSHTHSSHTPTNFHPLPGQALGHYMFSVLRSRVARASARNNEQWTCSLVIMENLNVYFLEGFLYFVIGKGFRHAPMFKFHTSRLCYYRVPNFISL